MADDGVNDKGADAPDTLSAIEASRLLPIGLSQPAGPVAEVIDRLRGADGDAWLRLTLERGPVRDAGVEPRRLLDPDVTVADLERVKDASKRVMGRAETKNDVLSATLAYFLAIAAALTHHGRLITSQRRDLVDDALIDLADAAPEPWSDLLQSAAMATDA
ncbi:MAG: hypothetical protein RIB32_03140 [Phycisphaerales bacterium]